MAVFIAFFIESFIEIFTGSLAGKGWKSQTQTATRPTISSYITSTNNTFGRQGLFKISQMARTAKFQAYVSGRKNEERRPIAMLAVLSPHRPLSH
tara:strand:- start:30428 stop:30712 length:285 start_codon:yes stop_codon:yes gene_type:complete